MEISKLFIFLILFSSCSTLTTNKAIYVSRGMEKHLDFNKNLFDYLEFDYDALENVVERKCLKEDFSKEVDLLHKLFLEKPKAYFQVEIGLCYQLAGEFPKALYYYDQGLSKVKKKNRRLKSLVFNNIGIMYGKRGHMDKAFSYLEKSLIEVPNNFISVYNMALTLTSVGRYEESATLITRFSGGLKETEILTKILGINYLSLNDFNSLESKVLKKLDDKVSEKIFLRAVSKYVRSGDSKLVYELIEDLDELNPLYKNLYQNLIKILKQKIRDDERKKSNAHIFKSGGIKVFRT